MKTALTITKCKMYFSFQLISFVGPVITKFITTLRELASFKELLRSQVSPLTRMPHRTVFLGVLLVRKLLVTLGALS